MTYLEQKRCLIKPRCNHLVLGHSKGFSCHLQVFEVNQVSIHFWVFLYQFRNLANAQNKIRRALKNWKKKWLHSLNVQHVCIILLRMIHMDEYGKIVARVSEGWRRLLELSAGGVIPFTRITFHLLQIHKQDYYLPFFKDTPAGLLFTILYLLFNYSFTIY